MNSDWDVLIVAGPGLAADLAYALHGQLARRDLRVKLDIAERPTASPFPAGVPEDAAAAGCCVVLATEGDVTKYAVILAPRFPGQRPVFAPSASGSKPGDVEIGVIAEDVASLAARIEDRVRALRE